MLVSLMAASNKFTEASTTPSKEQHAAGQVDAAEDEGENVQQPESRCH